MARPAPDGGRTLLLRSTSAIVIAVPALAAIAAGFPYVDALVAVVVVALAWEWSALCAAGRFEPRAGTVVLAACLAAVGLVAAGLPLYALMMVAGGAVVAYVVGRAGARAHAGTAALGALYVGLPAVAFLWLRDGVPDGRLTVLWMVLMVVATDIGAFAIGRAIGGPRLAPRVSPKKTWAGLAGGVAFAALAGILFSAALGGRTMAGLGTWGLAACSGLLAIIAQIGDLLESHAKRRFGVKDMSGIIPGHGGVFDRVDGHLAAAVAVGVAGLFAQGDVFRWR